MNILYLPEAAAAFEDLTLSDIPDTLTREDSRAWPNTFRKARFLSAVDHIQLHRLRYQVMLALDGTFAEVDAMIGPFMTWLMLAGQQLHRTSMSATHAGFIDLGTRGAASLGGGKHDGRGRRGRKDVYGAAGECPAGPASSKEAPILNLGMALERELGVADVRPGLPE